MQFYITNGLRNKEHVGEESPGIHPSGATGPLICFFWRFLPVHLVRAIRSCLTPAGGLPTDAPSFLYHEFMQTNEVELPLLENPLLELLGSLSAPQLR